MRLQMLFLLAASLSMWMIVFDLAETALWPLAATAGVLGFLCTFWFGFTVTDYIKHLR